MNELTIPLFPLHTVLFPGGILPLRIFEPRYLDMISDCLRNNHGFGVCLIQEGDETGPAVVSFDVGTLVSIHNWDKGDDGLLSITVRGDYRFRILSRSVQHDELSVGSVLPLAPEPCLHLPESYFELTQILEDILGRLGAPYADMPREMDNAGWVGARLTELLPLALTEKQALLERADPMGRLEYLSTQIRPVGMI